MNAIMLNDVILHAIILTDVILSHVLNILMPMLKVVKQNIFIPSIIILWLSTIFTCIIIKDVIILMSWIHYLLQCYDPLLVWEVLFPSVHFRACFRHTWPSASCQWPHPWRPSHSLIYGLQLNSFHLWTRQGWRPCLG